MTRLLVGFALVLVATLVECRVKRHSEESLELVHVIFRHGDRTPDKSAIYKNDPYANVTYYPVGYGQLTNAGKRKEYKIGKALRRRYNKFLSNFTLDTVDSRCTDYNRTKMSLQLVLASLFPPTGEHVWQKKLNWQPVPFNYWPLEDDHVLGDTLKNCPKYKQEFFDYLLSSEAKGLYENFTRLHEYLEEHTGQKLNSKLFAALYFTLTTEHENGYKMPDWAAKVYPYIKHLAIMDYNVSTATPKLKRLASGFLMQKIIDDTIAKAREEKYKETKVFLYSAHESNVAQMLRFLGIFYSHVPPYGSYLTFEVHNLNGERGFKIFYQDYSSDKPKKYKLPDCGSFLPSRQVPEPLQASTSQVREKLFADAHGQVHFKASGIADLHLTIRYLFDVNMTSQSKYFEGILTCSSKFFRHGARTPELKYSYPNDPHKSDAFLPMGHGQLTNYGKRQAYKLGRNLRKRYDAFLGSIYYPEIVMARSTDFDRTKMSLLLALAGLFTPAPSQEWDKDLHWMPIPTTYDRDDLDYTLKRPNSYCPKYANELEKVLHSEKVAALLEKHKPTMEYISESTGKPVETLSDVFGVFQTLTAERWMNLTLPEWSKKVFPHEITELAASQAYFENSNRILRKLNGGRCLKMVIDNMIAKSRDSLAPKRRKMYLYSGHENNVINVLAALDLFQVHIPNYSAAVILELHHLEDQNEWAVKVIYSKNVDGEPEIQRLEGCEVLCPLKKFLKITEAIIPRNFTQECESSVYLH
ncbi:hypothetical protein NQ317_005017 [Molorchus minor]|uniref:acid phosphatase n=1 Tax=Molorchus minor TaxID=1323400 RepID=A0ABQ9K414_9CUCU|nr:hypothetical protein NQ317_005017 [Molorchus minor]